MKRLEAVQYQVSGIGVLEGADLSFGQPGAMPCWDCGKMVDLTGLIAVGNRYMTEANARALLGVVGFPPPPLMCEEHDS